ncbi:MAG: hypothetical protein ACYTXT_33955 [Nostoc sp.]
MIDHENNNRGLTNTNEALQLAGHRRHPPLPSADAFANEVSDGIIILGILESHNTRKSQQSLA